MKFPISQNECKISFPFISGSGKTISAVINLIRLLNQSNFPESQVEEGRDRTAKANSSLRTIAQILSHKACLGLVILWCH